MGETFYSVLGLEADADADAVRAAYRELVKEHHPDVSDDPEAPERFKRLTTARDVLLDEDERSRYDRLGHRTYVRRHVESPAWPGGGGAPSGTDDAGASATSAEAAGGSTRTDRGSAASSGERGEVGGSRAAWLGEDWDPGADAARATGGTAAGGPRASWRRRGRGRHVRDSGGGTQTPPDGEPWQQAGATYRRSEAASVAAAESASAGGSLLGALGSVGPWLGIHIVFILSAIATAWFAIGQAGAYIQLSFPAYVFAFVLLGLVLFMSILHMVTQVYT